MFQDQLTSRTENITLKIHKTGQGIKQFFWNYNYDRFENIPALFNEKETEVFVIEKFSTGKGKFQINACVTQCGDDTILIVGGGTQPHIGSVAVAISHPSIKNPEKNDETASVLTVPGHKEDQIARSAALKLAKSTESTVSANIGIHIDDASKDDIEKLIDNFNQLIDQVEEYLTSLNR